MHACHGKTVRHVTQNACHFLQSVTVSIVFDNRAQLRFGVAFYVPGIVYNSVQVYVLQIPPLLFDQFLRLRN